MKKIAYIEIDTHAEIAQAFMNIMRDSSDFAVDYYFSERIRNRVEENGENVFLSDSSMILDQLGSEKYDLIMIGTVHRYFNTFQAVVQKYNAVAIVHNINFSQSSKWSLLKSIFKADIIYRIKLWWKEGLLNSSKVYQKAKKLLVLDEELSSDCRLFLPLFYAEVSEKTDNSHAVIVIPGGVSQKRRDYNHIFSVIQNLKVQEKYEFVFLGKAQDNELKQLEKLSGNLPENITVQYFPDRVSNEDFEKWMQKADVLWCPIQQKTEFFSIEEIYGITKMTGNLGDAITYGKMAVFPENYASGLEFIIPEKQDIISRFTEIKNIQFDFQKTYNKNSVLKRLESVLKSLI
ncbi:hypothetical protein [Chryseobacterium indologenes]|uniref:Glycosyltransferase n=1 Tax=Chryseobacterium indologenes TaxID=253 RepID=A0A0N0ZT97_CHRID|nr:hypothetical protein [Chryseobacterium indologenes]KPE49458.1 hypothetical protein AOB46_20065 [Chryseobacterium indologenes]